MDQLPLVSIIIPCYNREKYIRTAVDSCLDQIYPNIEIIVVDDGSSDNSVEVIKRYGDKVQLIEQENTGVSGARNKGLSHAHGEYIVFLDSDDWFSNDIIKKHIDNFLKWPELDAACAGSKFMRNGEESNLHHSNWPATPSTPIELFLLSPPPFPACVMYKATTIKKLGGMNENLKAFEDSELNIRMILSGGKVVRTEGTYAVYRPVENSLTKNLLKLHLYALQLIKQLTNEFKSSEQVLLLLRERKTRNRMRYWKSIFAYHFSLNPIEIMKFLIQLLSVSRVDPTYMYFIIKHKPWQGNTDSF